MLRLHSDTFLGLSYIVCSVRGVIELVGCCHRVRMPSLECLLGQYVRSTEFTGPVSPVVIPRHLQQPRSCGYCHWRLVYLRTADGVGSTEGPRGSDEGNKCLLYGVEQPLGRGAMRCNIGALTYFESSIEASLCDL